MPGQRIAEGPLRLHAPTCPQGTDRAIDSPIGFVETPVRFLPFAVLFFPFAALRFPIPCQFIQHPGKPILRFLLGGKMLAGNAQNIVTQRWIAAQQLREPAANGADQRFSRY